jgi:hypothetical protein
MLPQEIKALIVNQIGNLIGRYHPDNIPAIYIGAPPANYIVEGLEVNISTRYQMSRSRVQTRIEKWEILLTQYQPSPLTTITIHTAMDTLRDKLYPTPEFYFMDRILKSTAPDDYPLLPQCVVRWEIYENVHLMNLH